MKIPDYDQMVDFCAEVREIIADPKPVFAQRILSDAVALIEHLLSELVEAHHEYNRLWQKQHQEKIKLMCDPHDPCEMCKELAYDNE